MRVKLGVTCDGRHEDKLHSKSNKVCIIINKDTKQGTVNGFICSVCYQCHTPCNNSSTTQNFFKTT